MLRKDEPFLSVNWMEHFGEIGRDAQIAKIQEHIELSLAKYGLFAVLNVGEVLDQIERLGGKKLTVLYEPTPGDPSHSGIHGYQHEDDLIADLIADSVREIYPSRQL
jgi:hypothetical protein